MYRGHSKNLLFMAVLALFLLAGCTQTRTSSLSIQEPVALTEEVHARRSSPGSANAVPTAEPINTADPTGVLSLKEALSLSLSRNPELAVYPWETRAAEARMLQAGLRPNPQLEVEIENFGGPDQRRGFKTLETTFLLSQAVELGGKRSLRSHLAALEKDLIGWDYAAKRLEVLTEVSKAFVDTISAQEQLALAHDSFLLAEMVFKTVSERVEAGKVSQLEATRSGIEFSNARISLQKAKNDLEGARKRLCATWGQFIPTFERAEGPFDNIKPIPSAEELNQFISRNPEVARWTKEMEQRRAALDLENAKRIPDLRVGAGVRKFEETDDHAFVAAISIPLPLFDLNQGSIKEAEANVAKAKLRAKAAKAKVFSGLAEAYQQLSSAFAEVMSLKEEVLPAAELSFQASTTGYKEGKFDLLTFLDAQRVFFDARGRYLSALSAYHKAAADIERLTGEPLDAALTKTP